MVAITPIPQQTINAIERAVETKSKSYFSASIGGSTIGHACERHLWYRFRWSVAPQDHNGRMLRLFATGHVEEARMISWLRDAGIIVEDIDKETNRQWQVKALDGHFKGYIDGKVRGLVEAPATEHLLECKTHNKKSFDQLKKCGVKEAKPDHDAQMQIYMHLLGLRRAFYLAKCKDDDELYSERIHYDAAHAAALMVKAERIIKANQAPIRISDNPDYFLCKAYNCPSYSICHDGAFALRNCRSCLHAYAASNGLWQCNRHNIKLSYNDQMAGCPSHLYLPDLVPGEQIDADEANETVSYKMADESIWIDGDKNESDKNEVGGMINLRTYQQQALQSVFSYWEQGGGNPLIEMATGTGKSMVIAKLTKDIIDHYPMMRVLMLTHVKELVAQNFAALLRVWPNAPAGMYSAGLGKRDTHQRITFASIQSVYRKAKALGPRHLILIDEAHLVPGKGEGMYKKLLNDLHAITPDARVVGFTATPYRLDSGRLDEGEERLFDKIIYSYDISQGIKDGFLSPLMSKASAHEIDVSNIERRGGEFVASALEDAADQITQQAVTKILTYAEHRKSWLIFCAGVNHAYHVRDALRSSGISCETVTGDTPPAQRDAFIRRFKAGEIRALTNANVLTTGFDAPEVDCVFMLRPTLSTSLYVQIVGRGTRLAAGKDNCLILDFAGNVRRHGPVDAISLTPKNKGKDAGRVKVEDVKAKPCFKCDELVAINARHCKWCGYEWPMEDKPKHDAHAEAEMGILSSEPIPPTILSVIKWQFHCHQKLGSPDSLRVSYMAGIGDYPEWVAFEHRGQAGLRAQQWWLLHGGKTPFPKTVMEAIERQSELTMPETISVRKNKKYYDIVSRAFTKVRVKEDA